jgi:ubiquinone/menaquinone biosynthesis C-methylase UbiE
MGVPAALNSAVRKGLDYALEARLAPHYERHLVEECRYRTHEILADELALLEPIRGRWVDIGAGSGLVGKAIAARQSGIELVAVDISPAMLELIEVSSYVEKHVADGTAMPFPNASFQGALAAGLLEHVAEPRNLFIEVARVVRPAGFFLFSYPPNHEGTTQLFDAEQGLLSHDTAQIGAELNDAGLAMKKELDFPAYFNGSRGVAMHRLVVAHRR